MSQSFVVMNGGRGGRRGAELLVGDEGARGSQLEATHVKLGSPRRSAPGLATGGGMQDHREHQGHDPHPPGPSAIHILRARAIRPTAARPPSPGTRDIPRSRREKVAMPRTSTRCRLAEA